MRGPGFLRPSLKGFLEVLWVFKVFLKVFFLICSRFLRFFWGGFLGVFSSLKCFFSFVWCFILGGSWFCELLMIFMFGFSFLGLSKIFVLRFLSKSKFVFGFLGSFKEEVLGFPGFCLGNRIMFFGLTNTFFWVAFFVSKPKLLLFLFGSFKRVFYVMALIYFDFAIG